MGESAPAARNAPGSPPGADHRHPAIPASVSGDSDTLAAEMPNSRLVEANSIIEWRLFPKRLNDELALFLDQVWQGEAPKTWGSGPVEAPGS